MSKLPPGVKKENGQLVRYVARTSADDSEWKQRRNVALNLQEAKATRSDFYDPVLGWVLEGYKLERDRPTEDIVADASMSVAAPNDTEEEEGVNNQ